MNPLKLHKWDILTQHITSGGSGYTSPPTVTISGKGTGATAICTVANGAVTSIAITNSGSGYDQSTNISFSGGGGTGATAKGTIIDANTQWVKVDRLYKSGYGDDNSAGNPTGIDNTGKGSIVVNGVVKSGSRIRRIVPRLSMDLDDITKANVIAKIDSNDSFALRYNSSSQKWIIIDSSNLPVNSTTLNDASNWSLLYAGDGSNTGLDNSWLIRMNYTATEWES